jgi:hypothetical protein
VEQALSARCINVTLPREYFFLKISVPDFYRAVCTAYCNYKQLSAQENTGDFEIVIRSEESKRTARTITYAHLRGAHALNMGNFMKK